MYFEILKKIRRFNIFLILIIFSPALILFPIYEKDSYYVKDILTNISILLHALYIINLKNKPDPKIYNKFLIFILIPLISFNLFNHENQFFFIGVHLLFTIYVYKYYLFKKNDQKFSYYLFLIFPIILILISPGNWDKLNAINGSIEIFGAKINDQLAGNLNLAIGGFVKWHFFYHDIKEFFNFFICLLLTIFLFCLIFGYLINKKIIFLNENIKKNFLFFYTPSLLLFILALDYGRNINLILTHLLAFYLILDLNFTKSNKIYIQIKKNYLFKNLIFLFLIFYCFMWYLPQGGGYIGIGDFNGNSSILRNTILVELREIFMILYNFIDNNIISLPRIIV